MKLETTHLVHRKRIIFFLLVLVWTLLMSGCISNPVNSQSISERRTNKKPISYYVWVSQYKKPFPPKSRLVGLADSHVEVITADDYTPIRKTIPLKNIKTISIRKKGKFKKNIIIGTSIGLLIGAIYGYSKKKDINCIYCLSSVNNALSREKNGIKYGLITSATGALIGGLASTKIKIPINGKRENYKNKRKELDSYVWK